MKLLAKILVLVMIVSSVLGLYSCKSAESTKDTEKETTVENKESETETETQSPDESGEAEADRDENEETVHDVTVAIDTPAPEITDTPDTTDAPETDAPYTDAPYTDAPVTDAPVTDAPVTDDPVTDDPVTDDPVTDAPVTDAPDTEPPVGLEGPGSKSEPYLEIPAIEGNSMAVTTVAIPEGACVYYSIYRVGGMILTVSDPDAYVVCGDTRYDAVDGVVTLNVPAALASDAVTFCIGNNGAAAAMKLVFTNPVGSMANPQVINTITKTYSIDLEEGDSDGYNYVYTAEKSGTVRLYMEASVASIMSVTNNRNSAQRNTEADLKSDGSGAYVELEVLEGDEIVILVGAKPNVRGKYPATSITWSGAFA